MPEDARQKPGEYWKNELDAYKRFAETWVGDCQKIVDRYRLEGDSAMDGDTAKDARFNVLWSSTQTLLPALFSRVPEAIARRRWGDDDPLGRLASQTLQRAVNLDLETNGLEGAFNAVTLDVLLCARGVPWVRFEGQPLPPVSVAQTDVGYRTTDGEVAPVEQVEQKGDGYQWNREGVSDEQIMVDYVSWKDFAHSPEMTWADVNRRGWVARRQMMSKKEGMDRFGAKWTDAPGDNEDKQDKGNKGRAGKRTEVWEIWDRASKKRLFVAKGADAVLEENDDPYGLTGFFPCPMPVYDSISNEDLLPIPAYKQILPLARELDQQTARIQRITRALRLVGLYDSAIADLGKILDGGVDGLVVGVGNMEQVRAAGGLNGVAQFLDLSSAIAALQALHLARDNTKATIDEISGVSDIVRGQVDPREKASQSKLKSQYASQRLETRRRKLERCARDVCRIITELMVTLYGDERLRALSGFDFIPEVQRMDDQTPDEGGLTQKDRAWQVVMNLLRTDAVREIRIDLETDSTIELDAAITQESRDKFLNDMGQFLSNTLQVMEMRPELEPALWETLLFVARGHRAGRSLESAYEKAVEDANQRREAAQAQAEQAPPEGQEPPEPPDPAAVARAQGIQQDTAIAGAEAPHRVTEAAAQAATERARAEKEQIEVEKRKVELQIKQIELEQALNPPPEVVA